MQEAFDEEELQPVERQRDTDQHDTELTLGPMVLLGLFFGLVLLCGLCFGLGYSIGSRGAHASTASSQQTGSEATSAAAGSLAKPPASPRAIPQTQSPSDSLPPIEAPDAASTADSQVPSSASAPDVSSAQPAVRPALPAAATAPTPILGQPAQALRASSAVALMVQIAAVSHQEDADVLVGALRRRGYTVNIRRDPADSLLHVQIGPFSSRNDANAMRLKLLNDGYNAIVEP
jgi:cell division septation protein DedD